MFSDLHLNDLSPKYLQIKDYILSLTRNGSLTKGQMLPSTRELSAILNVGRNTVVLVYEQLESEGLAYSIKGKGTYVSVSGAAYNDFWQVNWGSRLTPYANMSEDLDTVKHESRWKKGMISFASIAPDEKLFDLDDVKRAFLNRISLEGSKLLNYGYAEGYKPLIEHLLQYMSLKGVDITGKSILITNGFTEGFDILLSALTKKGDRILCENPTHNTAIKIMKLHGLDITGIDMESNGINITELKEHLMEKPAALAYLIPSYHNPTGVTLSSEKRVEVLKILREYNTPVIEDGFNEELRFSGSHAAPLISSMGAGNGVIYVGSFSKILFPGLRIGWILADRSLISCLESIKRSRNIHTSFLDQAILYQYLSDGYFEKYLRKAKQVYREKYNLALEYTKKYIPHKRIWGEGGLHIFIELEHLNSRDVLEACIKQNVIFTPGDLFYTDQKGKNTLRLGISRVSQMEMKKGIKVIGQVIRSLEGFM